MNTFNSPAKIVFIGVATTLCVCFLWEIAHGTVVLDAKDFIGLAMMAFAFYFGANTPKQDTAGGVPFESK